MIKAGTVFVTRSFARTSIVRRTHAEPKDRISSANPAASTVRDNAGSRTANEVSDLSGALVYSNARV